MCNNAVIGGPGRLASSATAFDRGDHVLVVFQPGVLRLRRVVVLRFRQSQAPLVSEIETKI